MLFCFNKNCGIYLFQDVCEFAGNFRVVDFSKPEIILMIQEIIN